MTGGRWEGETGGLNDWETMGGGDGGKRRQGDFVTGSLGETWLMVGRFY